MARVLDDKLGAIAEICAPWRDAIGRVRLGATRRLHARRERRDLRVEFEPMELYARVDAYFGMSEVLRALLGRGVDLVMVGAVRNSSIAREIDRTKRRLYAP